MNASKIIQSPWAYSGGTFLLKYDIWKWVYVLCCMLCQTFAFSSVDILGTACCLLIFFFKLEFLGYAIHFFLDCDQLKLFFKLTNHAVSLFDHFLCVL